jgi:hypothetical protein
VGRQRDATGVSTIPAWGPDVLGASIKNSQKLFVWGGPGRSVPVGRSSEARKPKETALFWKKTKISYSLPQAPSFTAEAGTWEQKIKVFCFFF